VQVRKGAVEAVMGLTASEDGRALLRTTKIATQLRRLIGDMPSVSRMAITAMINISADAEMMDQLLKQGMVGSLMESLRDDDCTHKRLVVMLLSNLSQTGEGCDQLLGKTEGASALVGLHLRRLIQWFAASSALAAHVPDENGNEADTFEFVACILQNLTQLPEARRIILEPERGILPALMKQLRSPSVIRRRGTAAGIRNCLFESDETYLNYILLPSVDLVTALLYPLAGPDRYTAAEKEGMNPELFAFGARKSREPDPSTRRALVESIQLIGRVRAGRDHLRRVRAYPVLKAFHEWLEGAETGDQPTAAEESPGAMVGERSEGDEVPLHPEDEATVEAINRIVQQLFREDEIKHTSEVTAHREHPQLQDKAKASTPAPVTQPKGATLVPLDQAKELAAQVSRGADVGVTELESVLTIAPDWTEDDPELPPAFRPLPANPNKAFDDID
jgi:hypothetical protein